MFFQTHKTWGLKSPILGEFGGKISNFWTPIPRSSVVNLHVEVSNAINAVASTVSVWTRPEASFATEKAHHVILQVPCVSLLLSQHCHIYWMTVQGAYAYIIYVSVFVESSCCVHCAMWVFIGWIAKVICEWFVGVHMPQCSTDTVPCPACLSSHSAQSLAWSWHSGNCPTR